MNLTMNHRMQKAAYAYLSTFMVIVVADDPAGTYLTLISYGKFCNTLRPRPSFCIRKREESFLGAVTFSCVRVIDGSVAAVHVRGMAAYT